MTSAIESSGRRWTVAIIGAGQVAANQSRGFAQLTPAVEIAGVADINEQRASELAATYGTRAFTDYRALLDLRPDIAVICLPHHLHIEAALAAVDAGCHILMEKPLAHTLEDARTIVATCRRSGRRLATSFVHRFRDEWQQAQRLIAEGRIGNPALAIDVFSTPDARTLPEWVWHKDTCGGGVLMYTGIHAVDRLRWLLDSEVEEVTARSIRYTQPADADVEDGLLALLTFANGCIATLAENSPRYVLAPHSWDTEVFGTTGRLHIRQNEYLEYSSSAEQYLRQSSGADHWVAQAREFVNALREDRDPWISGEDGLAAQGVVEAVYRSSALDRPVRLSEVRDQG